VARYRDLVTTVESLTVVYDAGQSSGDNHAVVEGARYWVRGIAAALGSPRLLTIPARDYRTVDDERFPGCATSTPP
jgi:hypothetical protein